MKPERKNIELTEDEKTVLALLKAKSTVALAELKEQSALSNKKWDVSINGLTKNKLSAYSGDTDPPLRSY